MFRLLEKENSARLAVQDASMRRREALSEWQHAKGLVTRHFQTNGIRVPTELATLFEAPLSELAGLNSADLGAKGINKETLLRAARARDAMKRLDVVLEECSRRAAGASACVPVLCEYIVAQGGADPRKEY
jgi:hypothetical protein